MNPHIAIYTDDPDKGGVAQYNHRVATGFVAAGFRVSIIQSRSESWMVQAQAELGIAHRWIAYDTQKEFLRTVSDTATAEEAFEELKPDLVLFSDCCPVSNIGGREVAIRRGIPFVVVVNFAAAYLAERFGQCLRVLARQYAVAADVVAVSTENLQLLRQKFGLAANKGRVVFYGVPEVFFAPRDPAARQTLRAQHGLTDDAFVAVTMARLCDVKLHILQIHAAELLKRRCPKARLAFVWVGEGELRAQLQAEIAKRKLESHFVFAGQQRDVAPWYDMADAFVLTSQSEGMPIAIMEAMAKGLPVVATAVSGIPEELGETGKLLPDPARDAPGTVCELAAELERWMKNPAVRETQGRRSRQRAEQYFRVEQMVEHTLAVVRTHLNADRSAALTVS